VRYGISELQVQNVDVFYSKNKRQRPYFSFAFTQNLSFMTLNQSLGANKIKLRPRQSILNIGETWP